MPIDDKSLRKAQEALNKFSPRNTTGTQPDLSDPVYHNDPVGHVIINGISVPSEVAMKAAIEKAGNDIRRDMNEVLDNFEGGNTTREIVLKDESGEELRKIDGAVHYKFEVALKLAQVRGYNGKRKHMFWKGPAGSGKSTMAKQIAEALGLPYSYTGQVNMPHQVEGFVSQIDGKYYPTAFVNAAKDGGVWVGEEGDAWAPNASLILNPPLANGVMALPNGEQFEVHKDFLCIFCANTWGTGATADYVGRNKLDAAFLDRFAHKMDIDYDENLERRVAGNSDVVQVVQHARWNAQVAGIKIIISPRSSIDVSDMVNSGVDLAAACEMNFLSGVSRSDRKVIMADTGVY